MRSVVPLFDPRGCCEPSTRPTTSSISSTRMMRQRRRVQRLHPHSNPLARIISLGILLLLACCCRPAHAKKTSGDFKLSGVNTEHVLASFAVVPSGAKLKATLTAPSPYDRETGLRFRAYRDTEWPQFNKLQLCTEKIRLAQQTNPVSFRQVNGKWQADLQMEVASIEEKEEDGSEKKGQASSETPRNHYWYFVLDDCSLEQVFRDNRIPDMHYELSIQNYGQSSRTGKRHAFRLTHLGADDMPLIKGHCFTMILSALVCFRLFVNVVRRLRDRHQNHSVHAAVLWVGAAAAVDAWSSFLEMIHLGMYHRNGTGFYLVDCLAAHFEAITDSLIMMLLLSIAAGWTLPSSVVTVVKTNANPVQRLLEGLSHPISEGLLKGPVGMLAGGIFGLHLLLSQWGRMYNDDFESYHDLEHWPGRILMWTRLFTGLLFLAAVQQTSLKFTGKLQKFYATFAVTGFVWFLSLPVLTWICNWMVPYHLRRPAVFLGAAVLQSSSLVLLAWLVTTHSTAYHQVSRMTAASDTLSDRLDVADQHHHGSPRAWRLGKKAKVALD